MNQRNQDGILRVLARDRLDEGGDHSQTTLIVDPHCQAVFGSLVHFDRDFRSIRKDVDHDDWVTRDDLSHRELVEATFVGGNLERCLGAAVARLIQLSRVNGHSEIDVHLFPNAIYTGRGEQYQNYPHSMAWLIQNLQQLEPDQGKAFLAAMIGLGRRFERTSWGHNNGEIPVVDLNRENITYNVLNGSGEHLITVDNNNITDDDVEEESELPSTLVDGKEICWVRSKLPFLEPLQHISVNITVGHQPDEYIAYTPELDPEVLQACLGLVNQKVES